jgi:hypothetical protein
MVPGRHKPAVLVAASVSKACQPPQYAAACWHCCRTGLQGGCIEPARKDELVVRTSRPYTQCGRKGKKQVRCTILYCTANVCCRSALTCLETLPQSALPPCCTSDALPCRDHIEYSRLSLHAAPSSISGFCKTCRNGRRKLEFNRWLAPELDVNANENMQYTLRRNVPAVAVGYEWGYMRPNHLY